MYSFYNFRSILNNQIQNGGSNGSDFFNNLTATIAPTVLNDDSQGYEPGSMWINTTDDSVYTCTNNTTGNAVWKTSTLSIDDLSANLTTTWSSQKINSSKLDASGGTLSGDLDVTGDVDITGNFKVNGVNVIIPLQTGDVTNIILGPNSGSNITTGNRNTIYGNDVMNEVTGQDRNTSMGASSMSSYKGSSSTALGALALFSPNGVSGSHNTAIGEFSMRSQTTGSYNTAVGANSLYNLTTGVNNASLGSNSLFSLITGDRNSSFGTTSGSDLTDETNNVLLGYNTQSTGFSDSIVIGSTGNATASNQCLINNVTQIVAGSNNACDLGTDTLKFKDLYLSGNAIVSTTPTNDNHLVNKLYVDNAVSVSVPSIKLIKSIIQSIAPNANRLLTWDTTEFNVGLTAGTSSITIITPGTYAFGFEFNYDNAGTGRRWGWMTINSSARNYALRTIGRVPNTVTSIGGSTISQLNSGDVLRVWAGLNGVAVNVPAGSNADYLKCEFWCHMISL